MGVGAEGRVVLVRGLLGVGGAVAKRAGSK